MGVYNQLSVIRRSDDVDFCQHNYSSVYAIETTTFRINGSLITLPKGMELRINIVSIEPNVNVFVKGSKIFQPERCEIFDIKQLGCDINPCGEKESNYLLVTGDAECDYDGNYLITEDGLRITI